MNGEMQLHVAHYGKLYHIRIISAESFAYLHPGEGKGENEEAKDSHSES